MLKKFLTILQALILLFCVSCSNFTGINQNKNNAGSDLSITLPYLSAARAADGEVISFDVVFTHNGKNDVLSGKSGQTVTLEDAQAGKYSIFVMGYVEGGQYISGSAEADVIEGKNNEVTVYIDPDKKHDLPCINLSTSNDEISEFLGNYIERNPDCGFSIENNEFEESFQLKDALEQSKVPDIFCVEIQNSAAFVEGDYSKYIAAYQDLGIDVEKEIKEAEIFSYITKMARASDGKIMGLACQSSAGAYIYKKALARKIFGSDDPDTVEKAIGGGSGQWTSFTQAAETVANNECHILYSLEDLWLAMSGNGGQNMPYSQDGELKIPDSTKKFISEAEKLFTNSNLILKEQDMWSDDWYNAFVDDTTLGFFGPAWLFLMMSDKAAESDKDIQWGLCRAPLDFIWGSQLFFASNSLPQEKIPAVKRILQLLTLDTSEEGFMSSAATNRGDAVASRKIMEEQNNQFLSFTDKLPDNNYNFDEGINWAWVKTMLKHCSGENFDYEERINDFLSFGQEEILPSETTHIKAEPYEEGIKFTVIYSEKDVQWLPGGCWINNNNTGVALFMEDLPDADDPEKTYYYPLDLEEGKKYSFTAYLQFGDWANPKTEETIACQAGGGGEYIQYDTTFYDWGNEDKKHSLAVELERAPDTGCISGNLSFVQNIKDFITYKAEAVCEVLLDYNVQATDSEGEIKWMGGLINNIPERLIPFDELQSDESIYWELNAEAISALQNAPYYWAEAAFRFKLNSLPEDCSAGYFRIPPFVSEINSAESLKDDNGLISQPISKEGASVGCVQVGTDGDENQIPAGIKITLPDTINDFAISWANMEVIKVKAQDQTSYEHSKEPVTIEYVSGYNEYIYPFVENSTYYEICVNYALDDDAHSSGNFVLSCYSTVQGISLASCINEDSYKKIIINGEYDSDEKQLKSTLSNCTFDNEKSLITNSDVIKDFILVYKSILGNNVFGENMFWAQECLSLNFYYSWKEKQGGSDNTDQTSFGAYLSQPISYVAKDDSGNVMALNDYKSDYGNTYFFEVGLRFVVQGCEVRKSGYNDPEYNYIYCPILSQTYSF